MDKIAFYDTKPYDRIWFDRLNDRFDLVYHDYKLNADTAALAAGCSGVCAFVNDTIDATTIDRLCAQGVQVLAMRCAGYNNIDIRHAYERLHIVRVPAYSPYAVAEHAMAMLMTLNRKLHKAYNRTRDFNFSLVGLTGMDFYGKTVGIVGTGKIGRVFMQICRGFGMRVIAYDPYPADDATITYVDLDTLLRESDVVSLHCPLTEQTHHLLDASAFAVMKSGSFLVNTSRGGLVDSEALLDALNGERLRGAALDVYEEESDLFFEDFSGEIVKDEVLSLLVSRPNVLITSHQAFLTDEALRGIAETTLQNLRDFYSGAPLPNEVCYRCKPGEQAVACRKTLTTRCF